MNLEEGRAQWNDSQLTTSTTHILHNHCSLHKTMHMYCVIKFQDFAQGSRGGHILKIGKANCHKEGEKPEKTNKLLHVYGWLCSYMQYCNHQQLKVFPIEFAYCGALVPRMFG